MDGANVNEKLEEPLSDKLELPKNDNIFRPEDIAAAFFMKEKWNLKRILTNMSVKQIRRFVMHVAAYPMHDPGDTPKTDAEKSAAHLFNEMVTNKTMMQLAVEMEKAEAASNKITLEENNKTEEIKGELNGKET